MSTPTDKPTPTNLISLMASSGSVSQNTLAGILQSQNKPTAISETKTSPNLKVVYKKLAPQVLSNLKILPSKSFLQYKAASSLGTIKIPAKSIAPQIVKKIKAKSLESTAEQGAIKITNIIDNFKIKECLSKVNETQNKSKSFISDDDVISTISKEQEGSEETLVNPVESSNIIDDITEESPQTSGKIVEGKSNLKIQQSFNMPDLESGGESNMDNSPPLKDDNDGTKLSEIAVGKESVDEQTMSKIQEDINEPDQNMKPSNIAEDSIQESGDILKNTTTGDSERTPSESQKSNEKPDEGNEFQKLLDSFDDDIVEKRVQTIKKVTPYQGPKSQQVDVKPKFEIQIEAQSDPNQQTQFKIDIKSVGIGTQVVEKNFLQSPLSTVDNKEGAREYMEIILNRSFSALFKKIGKIIFKRRGNIYLLQHITTHDHIIEMLKKELIDGKEGVPSLDEEDKLFRNDKVGDMKKAAENNMVWMKLSRPYTKILRSVGKIIFQRGCRTYFLQHISTHNSVIAMLKAEMAESDPNCITLDEEERVVQQFLDKLSKQRLAKLQAPKLQAPKLQAPKQQGPKLQAVTMQQTRPVVSRVRKSIKPSPQKPIVLSESAMKLSQLSAAERNVKLDEAIKVIEDLIACEKSSESLRIDHTRWNNLIQVCLKKYRKQQMNLLIDHDIEALVTSSMQFLGTPITPINDLIKERKAQKKGETKEKESEPIMDGNYFALTDDEKVQIDQLLEHVNITSDLNDGDKSADENEEFVLSKKGGAPLLQLKSRKALKAEMEKKKMQKIAHNSRYTASFRADRDKALQIQFDLAKLYMELGLDVPQRVLNPVVEKKTSSKAKLDQATGQWVALPTSVVNRGRLRERLRLLETEKTQILEMISTIEQYEPHQVTDEMVRRTLRIPVKKKAPKNTGEPPRPRGKPRTVDPEVAKEKARVYKKEWFSRMTNPQKVKDAQAVQQRVLQLMNKLGIDPPPDLKEPIKPPTVNAADYIYIEDRKERKRVRHLLDAKARYHYFRNLPAKVDQLQAVYERLLQLSEAMEDDNSELRNNTTEIKYVQVAIPPLVTNVKRAKRPLDREPMEPSDYENAAHTTKKRKKPIRPRELDDERESKIATYNLQRAVKIEHRRDIYRELHPEEYDIPELQ